MRIITTQNISQGRQCGTINMIRFRGGAWRTTVMLHLHLRGVNLRIGDWELPGLGMGRSRPGRWGAAHCSAAAELEIGDWASPLYGEIGDGAAPDCLLPGEIGDWRWAMGPAYAECRTLGIGRWPRAGWICIDMFQSCRCFCSAWSLAQALVGLPAGIPAWSGWSATCNTVPCTGSPHSPQSGTGT